MAETRGFLVRNRNIMDSRNVKVRPGDTAYLTEELANHYNELGCIVVPVGGYSEQKILKTAVEPAAADNDGAEHDDAAEAGDDAENDAGEDQVEGPAEPATTGRRRRTAS